jgi:nicotinate phosphoribosyltransferase
MENHPIRSLLDMDYYKFTMAYLAYLFFPEVQTTFAFTNRSKIKLAKFISQAELEQEIAYVRSLSFQEDEIDFLFSTGNFDKTRLQNFLRSVQLPEVKISVVEDDYVIETEGRWCDVSLWETLILSIVNELYYRFHLRSMSPAERSALYAEGASRLAAKVKILKQHPEITFVDFGTRRRFSHDWQRQVLETLKKEVPQQLIGTSNVYMAKELGLKPVGTFAHEVDMVFSGIFRDQKNGIRNSHNKVLEYWWSLYGYELSIALTDTYGSKFFFEDMNTDQAAKWKGLRQDSGNPFSFAEAAIAFYQGKGIDPRTKIIVFSDGLDLEQIIALNNYCQGRIKSTFGWGTNLTNDLGLRALSLVMKAVKANGYGTVKLSDNVAKAIGSPADIVLFKNIFNYSEDFFESCRY